MKIFNPKHFFAKIEDIDKKLNHLISIEAQLLQNMSSQHDETQQLIRNSKTVRLGKTEVMTKIFSGAKMYLDTRDIGLVPHLILDGEWEKDITNAWLSTVKKGDTVIDIGANFGYFSVLAAQQTDRDCQIIMFEANPTLHPYLKKTMDVNSFRDISTIENVAMSNRKEKVVLNVLKDFIASSSVLSLDEINAASSHDPYEIQSSVEVDAISLDEYCKTKDVRKINLIKMDIEGYEDVAYDGMRKIVAQSPDISLFIEFTKKSYKHPEDFYNQMLKDFGHVYLINEKGLLVLQKNTDYGKVIGANSDWVMPVFSKNPNLAN